MKIPLMPTYTAFLPGNHIELILTNELSITTIKQCVKNNITNILTSKIDQNRICNTGVLAKIIKIIDTKPFKVLVDITNKTKIFNINHKSNILFAQYAIIQNNNMAIHNQILKILNQNLIKYSDHTKVNYFDIIYKDLCRIDLLPNQLCAQLPIATHNIKQKILELNTINEKLLLINKEIEQFLNLESKTMELPNMKSNKRNNNNNTNTTPKKLNTILETPSIEKIKKILKKNISIEAKQQIEQTLNKIEVLNPQHPEYFNQIQYINTLIKLPWEEKKEKKYTLKQKKEMITRALQLFNDSHYGMQQTKDYILEYLAAYLHSPSSLNNQTLCLIGAPGVGKTSLSYTISKCLDRPHVTIAVGGMRDAADLRGHQRTYLSALPGKIINAIITYQTTKIVILLDEIDKLSNTEKNDVYGVIIELLDPTQQTKFLDNYINIPFDISQILFLSTANIQKNIPIPIQNRLDILNIKNYSDEEKIKITQNYIIPKTLSKYNIKQTISFSPVIIQYIIDHYTSEAGIRDLTRKIEQIIRKILFISLNTAKKQKITITTKNIKTYLGNDKYPPKYNILNKTNRIGVINGLGVTNHGGKIITIETISLPEKANIISCTGNLSKIMLESANIAYNYCLTLTKKYNIPQKNINNNKIHFHITEGAIEKDGPSAGIAICLAILSNLLNIPIPVDSAVTGEITLLGNVLAIGGLHDKLLAAKKAKIKKVIIPYDNLFQLNDIDKKIIKELEIYPVKTAIEAIENVLFNQNKQKLQDAINITHNHNINIK